MIYQDIQFCMNGWWLNKINGLYDGPGKWECAPRVLHARVGSFIMMKSLIIINRQLNCPTKTAMEMEAAIQNNVLALPLRVMPLDLDI